MYAKRSSVPFILMYHSVAKYDTDPHLVTVSPHRFEEQMGWLARHGLRGTSVQELLAATVSGSGRGLVGLSFDDGYADFVTTVVPVLQRRGFTATVFVLAEKLGGQSSWMSPGPLKQLMTAEQVREAATAGIEIGSHGLRHPSLTSVTEAEMFEEVTRSKEVLQVEANREVSGFCYPYGLLNDRVVNAVRNAGYDYGVGIRYSDYTGRHCLPRTYIGDCDTPLKLVYKALRHRLLYFPNTLGIGPGFLASPAYGTTNRSPDRKTRPWNLGA